MTKIEEFIADIVQDEPYETRDLILLVAQAHAIGFKEGIDEMHEAALKILNEGRIFDAKVKVENSEVDAVRDTPRDQL